MINKQDNLKQIKIQEFKIIYEIDKYAFQPSENGLFYANSLTIKTGERVIDIGTGTGILAIYAAKKGATVCATDINNKLITLVEKNMQLNEVQIEIRIGTFFSDFTGLFDVIIANLPNEIVPESYTSSIGKQVAETFDGGKNGNELILSLLQQASKYMHRQSRLYLPVHALTDYHQVLKTAIAHYNARLIAIASLPVKTFVTNNLDFYIDLDKQGIVSLFKKAEKWYTYGYVYELTLKN